MRAAGPPRRYLGASLPLVTLLQELNKHPDVRYVHVQRADRSLVIENRSAA
jgi:hypothetical protein